MSYKLKCREKATKKQKQAGKEIADLFENKILPLMEKGDLPSIEVNHDLSQYGVSLRMTVKPVEIPSIIIPGGIH